MKFSLPAVLSVTILALVFYTSCERDKDPDPNPCAGVTVGVTASVTNTPTGQSAGSIAASATGGSGFTYSKDGTNFQASGTFNNLAAGSYTITAKNSNGCTGSAQFTVAAINACTGVNITVTGTVTNATTGQSNGSIAATATGSTGFTYSKDGGVTFQATGTFNNLAAGSYTITAKDANGCTGTAQFNIGTTNPCTGITITVTGVVTNATTGQNNGSIVASASGSTGFTYSKDGVNFQATGTFNNLAAGSYTITAKDANGCTGTAQFNVGTTNPCTGVTITVTGTVTNATTGNNNGSIAASASGSTGFTYSKDGVNFQASGTFNNLAAGNYTITAKDGNGCTGTAQFNVGTTNPCTGVTITVTGTATPSVPCGSPANNGSITANASGSAGAFTYSINGTNFQASNVFNNLAPGNYTVTAKNSNGCTGTSANISVGTATAGPMFLEVKSILQANCALGGCHNAQTQQSGINFENDCHIVTQKDRIKFRAVDQAGTASQMPPPPNPALSATDRQKITNWVNAGGGYNN